jgi:hypothetical protein
MQRKSQFQPVIVNYEDISKNSLKGRVNSTRHQNNSANFNYKTKSGENSQK